MGKEVHSLSPEAVITLLNSSKKGLSKKEANERLLKYGKNELIIKEQVSALKIFLLQFNSVLIWIMFGAVILSFVVKEYIDAVAILVILILNAILGFVQEYRAEKSIESLKKMAVLKCTVMRGNEEMIIDAKDVVPGDILILEEGVKIAADARLIESFSISTQEAALTGESTPITKKTEPLPTETQLADRKNMIYSGTLVSRGRGIAIAVSTGMSTEFGKIATMLEEIEPEPTPLQKKLKSLGKVLGIITIAITFIVFIAGILRGIKPIEMFITSIALAVAAIPEGLPAVVTVSLAIGVQRMVKRNALIRKLPSVETLGSTTVICSDKTGTLTLDEMTVKKIYVDNKTVDVYTSALNGDNFFSEKPRDLNLLLSMGVLSNNATIHENGSVGDTTEIALLNCGLKAGMKKNKLLDEFERIGEIPFSSESKCMITIHKTRSGEVSYMKGAPDVILKKCNRILSNGRIKKLYPQDKEDIIDANDSLAKKALRVLGFAYKETGNNSELENEFVFVGLQGMIDPPREEAKEAIVKCKQAGIKVVMITGDHKLTAMAIAKELGIAGKAITGEELDKIEDLSSKVEDIAIYARVNPSHKLKIIDALKKKGHIVAMTGDGVNDAPALKEADIGISMGIKGTDVAKESSHMILTDDNFTSIVNAIEEGRSIYDNIKKFVAYLLSCNLGEVLVIFIASLLGWPLPLIAIQLLWINLVTDGLPALALGVDPATKDIMKRKPRNPKEHILSKNMVSKIIITSLMVLMGTLFLFNHYLPKGLELAQTVAFTALVFIEMAMVFIVRYSYHQGFFSNTKLLFAIISSLALQVVILYTPLGTFFNAVPLGLMEWASIGIITFAAFVLGMFIDTTVQKATKEFD